MISMNNLTINNLLENIKRTFNNLSTNFTVEIALYLAIGFLLGFIFKYTSKYIIGLIIIITLSLLGLESIEAITINYSYIKELLGLSMDVQAADIINHMTTWIQNHIPQCLSSGLGFYLAIELL